MVLWVGTCNTTPNIIFRNQEWSSLPFPSKWNTSKMTKVNQNHSASPKESNCQNVSETRVHTPIFRTKWRKRKLKMFATLAKKTLTWLRKSTNAKTTEEWRAVSSVTSKLIANESLSENLCEIQLYNFL